MKDKYPVTDADRMCFVGEEQRDNLNIFACLPSDVEAHFLEENSLWEHSRQVLARCDAHTQSILSLSMSAIQWLSSAPFCSRCGAPTMVKSLGLKRVCSSCSHPYYPSVSPAMIVCVLDGKGNVLLSERRVKYSDSVKPMRTILAGFVAQGESMEETVVREVEEESAAVVTSLRYVGSQPWPYPYQLMTCYYAVADQGEALQVEQEELVSVEWVSREEVQKALAGEHPDFVVPPNFTAAHVLLSAWADGRVNDRGE